MMQQQMSLFQEGGLEQDGGTVDPVSGNDVPVGSSQEEVRDDIPAQLSEGEFVFPADVVRFIGLEKLMMMRQEAKAGLKRMEEMGQMGNSEEATMPDDLPFTIDDLDMEDDPQEMAQGGVMAANGVFTQPSKFQRTPIVESAQQPANQPRADEQATFYNAPTQTTEQQPIASFEDLFGGDVSYGYDELRKYVGPNGEIEYIAFKGGEPLPAYTQKLKELTDKGFTYEDPTKVDEDPTNVRVDTAQVTQKEDREGDSTSFQNMQQRENDIQESYKSAIKTVMDAEGISAEDAVQFIKDGNYKIMGKTVPAFLFPDIKLANQSRDQQKFIPFGLNEAAVEVRNEIISAEQFNEQGFVDDTGVGSDALGNTTNLKVASPSTTLGTTNVGSASIPATVSDAPVQKIAGSSLVQDPSQLDPASLDKTETIDDALAKAQKLKEAEEADAAQAKALAIAQANIKKKEDEAKAVALKEAEEKRMAVETARLNAIAQREQEKADRDAAQAARDSRTQEQKAEVSRSKREGGQGYVRAKGGLMNKPKKKKVMKRGGLASKK
tara:strand:+ start:3019 stop:4671 length:1653 start_codon:yes stop_codon:yes gene_type:complete